MKNRKGSVLVLVVLLFAILSVFSVFTLSFMQTENKQSLNYEFKTQAYLAAVSGAETVEEALIRQLNSYGENSVEQQKFLEVYASPGKVIDLNIPGVNEVKVTYTDINGKKVLTIESEGEVREVKEVVQKVLYSVENIVTSTNNGQLVLTDGQFLVYLNGAEEHSNKNRPLPVDYFRKASPEQAAMFVAHPFPEITNWTQSHSSIKLSTSDVNTYETIPGTYGIDGQITNIFVDGNLNLTDTVAYLGEVNIFVRGSLHIKNNAKISGTKVKTGDQEKNQLNIYVYNEYSNSYALNTDSNVSFNIKADFYIGSNSKVNFDLHQNVLLDGSVIYNGNGELLLSVQSNNFVDKILTGSIYAPSATVRLGLDDYKIAYLIGGHVVADFIHVYGNNNQQLDKFYIKSSTEGSSVIPVNISKNVTTRTISYKSYFNDEN